MLRLTYGTQKNLISTINLSLLYLLHYLTKEILKSIGQTEAERVVKTKAIIVQGLKCRHVPLLNDDDSAKMKTELEALGTLLDSIQSYNSYGKLKAFKFTEDELTKTFKAYPYCVLVDKLKEKAEKFERMVGYLYTALSYVVEAEKPLFDEMKSAIDKLP